MAKLASRALLVLAGACVLATPDARAQWSTIGIARLPYSTPGCGQPLGPSQGELFAVGTFGPREAPTRTLACINGQVDPTRVDWDEASGAWQVTSNTLVDGPNVTITAYPNRFSSPLTEHRGLLLLDDEDAEADGWLQQSVAQELPTPVVRPGPGVNHVAWQPLVLTGRRGACEVGGEDAPDILPAWNVYRVLRSDVPPSMSTPDHYLCGPDLDCARMADNGFRAMVLNLPSPVDGLIHFDDTGLPLDASASDYVYVVQPVKTGAPTGDANGDGIPDEDLDSDGIPEFVDPSGTGRGLTARVEVGPAWRKPILISPDSETARDVTIYVRKVGAGYRVSWDPLGLGSSSDGHDLHAGDFSDWRDSVAFAARDRLACDLPDGPGSVDLVDPGFARGNRYYLMSVAYVVGPVVVEQYGADSLGVDRPPTSTPPPCR